MIRTTNVPKRFVATIVALLIMAAAPNVAYAKTNDETKLEKCKGKTAEKALDAAEEAKYSYKFLDSADVDVTKDIENKKNKEARQAKVVKVELEGGFLFFRPSATFKLNYTDKEAEAQRIKEEKSRAALRSKVGKKTRKAYKVAKKSDFEYDFQDRRGESLLDSLEKKDCPKEILNAPIKSVDFETTWFSSTETVIFTVDYVDLDAKRNGYVSGDEESEDLERMEACVGKPASEAIAVAEELGYNYRVGHPGDGTLSADSSDSVYFKALNRIIVTEVQDHISGKLSDEDSYVYFVLYEKLSVRPEDDDLLYQILTTPYPDQEQIDEFNEKYVGKMIEFDGCVIEANKHPVSYGYYDYVLKYGDYDSYDPESVSITFNDADNLGTDILNKRVTPRGPDAVGGNYTFCAKVRGYFSDTHVLGLKKQYAKSR